ncbi:hypothetical protein AAFC00_004094 [Neodothiora populina]|uniref:Uncharacterized protein n=1 Tax=Neodothiora populina TaxID=2781224 RepID=A0ABR3PII8_9PEZI
MGPTESSTAANPVPSSRLQPDQTSESPSTKSDAITSAVGPSPIHGQTAQPSLGNRTPREHAKPSVREESRRAAWRKNMEMIAETNEEVRGFMQELELKRKQLDEQIHKFIAQKEREFKRFEQEIWKQIQNVQEQVPVGSDHGNEHGEVHSTISHQPSRSQDVLINGTAPSEAPKLEKPTEDHGNVRTRIDRRTANSGLEDIRPSYEREKDFMGLFTPAFLPLLDDKPGLERSPSAPDLMEHRGSETLFSDRQSLQRANTEPTLDAEGKPRPRHGPRTPSTGSEGLVSVLKPPGGRKSSKQMRVMLQLADDLPAVHPNDDLPTEREYAPVRQADALHHSKKGGATFEDASPLQSPSLSPGSLGNETSSQTLPSTLSSSLTQGLSIQPQSNISLGAAALGTQPGNAVTDFEDLASPFPLDEDVGDTERPSDLEWEVDFREDIEGSRVDRQSSSPSLSPDTNLSPISPQKSNNSATSASLPMLKIRSSSTSSTQPISPGFSRPSVRDDPIFDFPAEENDYISSSIGHGSYYDSFSRPSLTGRGTMTGSLGESFMQRNAEAMMRRKRS